MQSLVQIMIPIQCQMIIWTNADLLLIGTMRTKFRAILMQQFSQKETHLKILSAEW